MANFCYFYVCSTVIRVIFKLEGPTTTENLQLPASVVILFACNPVLFCVRSFENLSDLPVMHAVGIRSAHETYW